MKIQRKHNVKRINKNGKCLYRVFFIMICTSLILYHFPNSLKYAFADNVVNIHIKIDLNNDGNDEIVKLNNGILNISNSAGKVIFKKNEVNNVYSTVALIMDKGINDTKIIFQNKTRDTAGILSYSIYKMDGGEIKEIVHREDIYKGVITVKNNKELVEEVPIYAENDSNAVPSYIVRNHFNLEDNKLVLLKTEKLSYGTSSISSITSEYYKNPSYTEIQRMLENVAYEKGIPAEILKAIAWQESKGADKDNSGITNWRQFANGQPLIGSDGKGIGIMQVSDLPTDTAYINRLKYDIEFNIREGAEILLKKWSLQNSSIEWKTPKVGDGSPNYLEHWYYAIWAYNSYSSRNNPASNYSTAYQTLVIGHANKVFNKPMIDLYVYNPSLFTVGVLPRVDIAEISDKNAGDFKIKDKNYKYIVTADLTIRDENMLQTGSYNKNQVVTIKSSPIIIGSYVRYYVEGNTKSGYVAGNWLKPIGDVNGDFEVDIYDFVKESKFTNGEGTVVDDTNRIYAEILDVNMDGVVDIKDIELLAENYNFSLYKNNVEN